MLSSPRPLLFSLVPSPLPEDPIHHVSYSSLFAYDPPDAVCSLAYSPEVSPPTHTLAAYLPFRALQTLQAQQVLNGTCSVLLSDVPFIFVLSPGASVPTVVSAGDLSTVNAHPIMHSVVQRFHICAFISCVWKSCYLAFTGPDSRDVRMVP